MVFKNIGLMTQRYTEETLETLVHLINYLSKKKLSIVLEADTAKHLGSIVPGMFKQELRERLGASCDLIIVVGGDGSLLNAARAVVAHETPLLGINRGTLGFLADMMPDEIEEKLELILQGVYQEEKRFLLETHIEGREEHYPALNEVILVSSDMAKMIEFEIYVDDVFMCSQRSDGLIIATPTGSTAYALSAGGPILYPNLDVIVMIPMFPHSLNNRPIVISNEKKIHIEVSGKGNQNIAYVSCDSHTHIKVKPLEKIFVHRMKQELRLLHSQGHDYFKTLRSKLGWGVKIIKN